MKIPSVRRLAVDDSGRWLLPSPMMFAVLFSAVWLLHTAFLRLPYFWDEAGYFIPAARDLLLTGDLIPHSTVSNAHPPLVMVWLAFWWKFSSFTPAVTRTAMLLVSAFALLGVFRLARQVSNAQIAGAATLLTALYPVFFAQSSLAHLDMMAAAFTIWGLSAYLRERRWQAIVWFAMAGVAKETALVTPMALAAWELVQPLVLRGRFASSEGAPRKTRAWWQPLLLLLATLPLAGWLAYHYSRTGIVFGNPEYFRYNVAATANPLRIALALLQRLFQMFGYLNMFVLTGAAALAMGYSPLQREGQQRPRIAIPVQLTFGVVALAYLVMLATVGGAVLARYLLPVYPLVIIVCVSTLWRRVPWWPVVIGLAAVTFVAGLFSTPPYRISPEDNLTYVDFVRLHRQAADKIATLPNARVLTAWPATDELSRPYLGYVTRPVPVVGMENFSLAPLMQARLRRDQYNYVLVFSSKFESPQQIGGRWWENIQTRYFDYHRDLPPEAAAEILGGRIIFKAEQGVEWVAVIETGDTSDVQNACLPASGVTSLPPH